MYDPIKLMILIYLCEDVEIPKRHLRKCRVNPSIDIESYRTDLEFYVLPLQFRFPSSATISYFTPTWGKHIFWKDWRKAASWVFTSVIFTIFICFVDLWEGERRQARNDEDFFVFFLCFGCYIEHFAKKLRVESIKHSVMSPS